ncbi:MAG: L,D-transpeptidase family protein [Granulosicoccus sp.]
MNVLTKNVLPSLLFGLCTVGTVYGSDRLQAGQYGIPGVHYERSGPPAAAADAYQSATSDNAPALGLALPFSSDKNLALELTLLVSSDSRNALAQFGPWLNEHGISNNAYQLLFMLEDSRAHGLNPNQYGYEKLRDTANALAGINELHTEIAEVPSALRDAFSNNMNAAFIVFAADMSRGVTDARNTQRGLYRNTPVVDIASLSASLDAGTATVMELLQSIMPMNDDYQRLTSIMRTLLEERESGIERTRVSGFGSMWQGQQHDDVFNIKQRLIETGDMFDRPALSSKFDTKLEHAVMQFQRRHGLAPSGIVDKRTRTLLNTSVDQDIADVAVSLERWRWMQRDLGERHVWVNLPDYRMQLVDGSKEIIDMNVVVGAVDHQTPSFSRNLSYIDFNPTWTVPRSIAEKELLPREIKNPGYLQARNFNFLEVVNGKRQAIPYSSVRTDELAQRPFPYILRQDGGPRNALGRVKFMMPNPHSIYLHDTPAKKLFGRTMRAHSHGCIRLGNPVLFAHELLALDGRSTEEIDNLLEKTNTTRTRLRRLVPTHLAYFTTWIDDNGIMQKRPDIYSHDEALQDALRTADSLLMELRGTDTLSLATI